MSKSNNHSYVFQDAVPSSFASIITDCGFSLTQVKDWMFELKSQSCLITVILDKQQIFVDIQPARSDQVPSAKYFDKLDLGLLLNCLDPHIKFRYNFNREPEQVRKETDRLARLLTNGASFRD